MSETSLIRIYNTPKGPHVHIGDIRVHHWTVGMASATLGILGLIFDNNKKHRAFYVMLSVVGIIAFIDDLPDFLDFLGTSQFKNQR